ncbi:MAG: glycosyltransferase family 9 protein [bacterium]
MKIDTMKRMDQYFGPLICMLLSPLRKFLPAKKTGEIRKILIIKFWGMGSIMLASPALKSIKKKFPESQLLFLTLSQNKELCQVLKTIDKTICLDVGNFFIFLISLWKIFLIFRKEKFDLAIDLEFFTNFTALITFLTGSRNTVGFQTYKFWRNGFYTRKVSFAHSKHIMDIFLKMVQVLGLETKDKTLEKPSISFREKKRIEKLFKTNHVNDSELLVSMNINTNSLFYNRRWPKENFAQLSKRLLERKNIRIFLIGGKEDKEYVESFQRLLKFPAQVINLCGQITIGELIALLERCHLLIGNDSGPLHLAAALRLPTVSFFGPETPFLYGPVGSEHSVFYKDLPCSPCLNVYNVKSSDCKDNKCLKAITVEEVWKEVKKKIGKLQEMKTKDI